MEQDSCLFTAIRTPPPLDPCLSLRNTTKLGRSARISASETSSKSHVSVSTRRLLSDDDRRFDMILRLGRKLRMLEKITDKQKGGLGHGVEPLTVCWLLRGSYNSLTVCDESSKKNRLGPICNVLYRSEKGTDLLFANVIRCLRVV